MLMSEDDVHSENEDTKIELKGFLSKWVSSDKNSAIKIKIPMSNSFFSNFKFDHI